MNTFHWITPDPQFQWPSILCGVVCANPRSCLSLACQAEEGGLEILEHRCYSGFFLMTTLPVALPFSNEKEQIHQLDFILFFPFLFFLVIHLRQKTSWSQENHIFQNINWTEASTQERSRFNTASLRRVLGHFRDPIRASFARFELPLALPCVSRCPSKSKSWC